MSIYKGVDGCTDLILDTIAKHESNCNYNAVIGNARSSCELGAMTLTEIDDLMSSLLESGEPSTAVGRYQIIRATFATLRQELHLSNQTLFTPVLQDQLGVQLLVGRGYKSWWRNEISDTTLAHGLSCEWASIPDPRNGGRSHYDGVGYNHAGMRLDDFMRVLDSARTLRDAPKTY